MQLEESNHGHEVGVRRAGEEGSSVMVSGISQMTSNAFGISKLG
jgi:hypothetical protein